jgi:hypothetical protein
MDLHGGAKFIDESSRLNLDRDFNNLAAPFVWVFEETANLDDSNFGSTVVRYPEMPTGESPRWYVVKHRVGAVQLDELGTCDGIGRCRPPCGVF